MGNLIDNGAGQTGNRAGKTGLFLRRNKNSSKTGEAPLTKFLTVFIVRVHVFLNPTSTNLSEGPKDLQQG